MGIVLLETVPLVRPVRSVVRTWSRCLGRALPLQRSLACARSRVLHASVKKCSSSEKQSRSQQSQVRLPFLSKSVLKSEIFKPLPQQIVHML